MVGQEYGTVVQVNGCGLDLVNKLTELNKKGASAPFPITINFFKNSVLVESF
jgi:hypothetical protein